MLQVDYSEFVKRLEEAGTCGGRIEKRDKAKWRDYVRGHRVSESACEVHARQLPTPLLSVIINVGGEWDGYYLYSPSGEAAMRFRVD